MVPLLDDAALRFLGFLPDELAETPVEAADMAIPAEADPGAGVADRQALERAFDRLSIDERTILVLHHLDGRPERLGRRTR